ncbi:hydrophobic surface binding protein A-domain-containing protein [Lentinula edodes]|nr:hydrophobic surface binding protein A-domain-containing protein [Lentinula edodes]
MVESPHKGCLPFYDFTLLCILQSLRPTLYRKYHKSNFAQLTTPPYVLTHVFGFKTPLLSLDWYKRGIHEDWTVALNPSALTSLAKHSTTVMIGIASFTTLSIFTAACLAAVPLKRDVATVENDIANVASQVTALDSAINAFPTAGGSLVSALAIHDLATSLASALAAAATDVAATTPFSDADAAAILELVEGFEPRILDALNGIVTKKPGFDSLPLGDVSALVAQDLATLATDTKAFENGLIADTPADLLAQATPITSAIDAALATASAAYAAS